MNQISYFHLIAFANNNLEDKMQVSMEEVVEVE